MTCDSQTSLLARTFGSLCFGCEPKAKVATLINYDYRVKHKFKNTLFIPMGLITSRASKNTKL